MTSGTVAKLSANGELIAVTQRNVLDIFDGQGKRLQSPKLRGFGHKFVCWSADEKVLFAGSEEGGETAATIMSIIATCKRLGINPFVYMKDVLSRFASAKTSQIEDFLPDRWLALKDAQSHPT